MKNIRVYDYIKWQNNPIICCFSLFTEQDHYSLAFTAWHNGEQEKAIHHIKLSYQEKPDSNKLVRFMFLLWLDAKYHTETYRHYAEALRHVGRRKEAVNILIEAIDLQRPDVGKNLLPLIQRVWTESYLAYELIKRIINFLSLFNYPYLTSRNIAAIVDKIAGTTDFLTRKNRFH